MRVKVEDTGQLTSCFNESEGRKIQVNLLRVLIRVKVERYRSTYFVF